jgi:hypothetical protein
MASQDKADPTKSDIEAQSALSVSLEAQGWNVEQLTRDQRCEWVRSWLGVLGLVRVDPGVTDAELPPTLDSLVNHAHNMLDQLPEETLGFEDLWNVTLLVKVPWSRDEVEGRPKVSEALMELSANTTGSRKMVVWGNDSILEHIGKMTDSGAAWLPISGDPIREALLLASRDRSEAAAIETLIDGGRISDASLDELVGVFARQIQGRPVRK